MTNDEEQSAEGGLSALLEQHKTGKLSAAERLKLPCQPMPQQEPAVRIGNFNEVALGYTQTQAKLEALRCLGCKNSPCTQGCPVRIRIKDFIAQIVDGNYKKALDIIKENSLLPAVCGRVCPQEVQCQAKCTVGLKFKDPTKAVSIGRLERFVADLGRDNKSVPAALPPTGKKVAVVGSGPGSIVAATDTKRAGHDVTVFEAFHKPGGVMVYGIPEFRLPKSIVQKEIETLVRMGVKLVLNFVAGRTRTIEGFLHEGGFDAVFIGTGAGLPQFMGIEGESLVGVYSANEYLTRANLMKAYKFGAGSDTPIARSKKVAVVGGGNVAMDSARMARRLGAESVYLVYRRTEKEMPARVEEVHHAKEEGIEFCLLQSPKRIIGDENHIVKAVECLHYRLGEPDASGRRSPIPVKGSEFQIEVDTVIIAIGNITNPLIRQTTPNLEFNSLGNIIVDSKFKTSMEGVYAGGDVVAGSATVILAMGHGRAAAQSINEYLENKR